MIFTKTSFKSKLLLALGAVVVSAVVANAAVKEGEDYVVLKTPITNAQNTVIEVYSYACPFCYKYSKLMPAIVKNLPKGVTFKPYHLKEKGGYGTQASQVLAVAMAKDKKAGIDTNDTEKSAFQKAEHAFFNDYHVNNKWHEDTASNPEAFIKVGLDAAGISEDEFKSSLNNADVQALLKSWDESYNVATVQGVPAFVVNGKYLIYTKSIQSLDDLESKIQELIKK